MRGLPLCVCVRARTHSYTSYNWYSNPLPQQRPTAAVFQPPEPPPSLRALSVPPRSKQRDADGRMEGGGGGGGRDKLKRMALTARAQINKWPVIKKQAVIRQVVMEVARLGWWGVRGGRTME